MMKMFRILALSFLFCATSLKATDDDMPIIAYKGVPYWQTSEENFRIFMARRTGKVSGTNTVQPVDYKQGDKRWGKVVYTACGNKIDVDQYEQPKT